MQLVLGTVQFGLDYGISNTQGRPDETGVRRILDCAAAGDITVLDTASLYGASEEVLGRCLTGEHPFDIVTKTMQFRTARIAGADAGRLVESFRASLRRLRRERVYGLLVHHADDLLVEGGEYLWDVLVALREQGSVARIGASVYSGAQIDALLARFPVEIVQLPLNVLDQRLVRGGQLARLRACGVEVHARSAFLQGLLLMDPADLPQGLAAAAPLLARWRRYVESLGMSPLESALDYVLGTDVDRVVVGVARVEQLQEILRAWSGRERVRGDYARFACDDETIVNPSLWKH